MFQLIQMISGIPPVASIGFVNERGAADARLIAAAPELLKALNIAENTLAFANGETRHKVTLELVRAAIAKAEGRE